MTGQTSLIYKGNDGTARIITPDNYSTVSQYNELKISVSNGKSAVASAITDKGVSTSATASFDTMASNIRSIISMSSPKLIPSNILWSEGTTDAYGNVEYAAYTPPIFVRVPEMIIMGHKILSGYTTITGSASTITANYRYYFYNIITGNLYNLTISEYSYTGTLPSAVKNGDPYLIIFTNSNTPMYTHKAVALK